jgi:heparin binding hemagglutinin HbhA
MPTLLTSEDVRKAGEQAAAAVTAVLEQAKTPLLATLGASDLAGRAIADALTKARTQVNERAEAARTAVDELPGLREKLDVSELRKLLDTYTTAASNLYNYLAERGEETLEKLREQPQVKQVLDQVGDLQNRVDDVLGTIGRRTRSAGEKAAEDVEEVVIDAGAQVASETRKAANKVSAPRKAAAKPAEETETTEVTES